MFFVGCSYENIYSENRMSVSEAFQGGVNVPDEN
jgi:hypothetical protein